MKKILRLLKTKKLNIYQATPILDLCDPVEYDLKQEVTYPMFNSKVHFNTTYFLMLPNKPICRN